MLAIRLPTRRSNLPLTIGLKSVLEKGRLLPFAAPIEYFVCSVIVVHLSRPGSQQLKKTLFMKTLFPTNLISTLPFALLLLVSSCADDGPVGPAGPAGPPGPTGATGSPNVVYGAWFKPDSYEMTTLFGIKNFAHTQQVPAITQEVLDKGVVLVYAKLLGYN